MRIRLIVVLLAAALCGQTLVVAQWSHDPSRNTPVCTAPGDQSYPVMAGDGEGGAIIAWTDGRTGENDIFAQHIDASGRPAWPADGLPVCIARNDQTTPAIVSDDAGGAIIVWTDDRSGEYDIYAQRLGRDGTILWKAGGLPVCTAPHDQVASTLVADGSGGAIVTWRDLRGGARYDIYAQRLTASGTLLWSANGIAVCTAPDRHSDPVISGDGSGGAIIAWLDNRGGSSGVCAQRLTGSGFSAWDVNGIPISPKGSESRSPSIISDGAGGAIIVWRDSRRGSGYEIFAQRVNGSGAVQWEAGGFPVCVSPGDQESPRIVADGRRGGIVVWTDKRSGSGDIYAQHLDVAGANGWRADGIPVCRAGGNQMYPAITSDGLGGAIITWLDYRRGEGDIYAQRIDPAGASAWTPDGVPVCTAPGEQFNPAVVAGSGNGAIITWYDYRSGTNSDIDCQRIDRAGYLGDPAPQIAGSRSAAGASNRSVTLLWKRSYPDIWPNQTITGYEIWRGVRSAGPPEGASLTQPSGAGASLMSVTPAGFSEGHSPWLRRVSAQGAGGADSIYWQYMTTVKPHWLTGYSYTMTLPNDLPEDEHDYFMVTALTSDPLVYWDSGVSGTPSTRLLPPEPPPLSQLGPDSPSIGAPHSRHQHRPGSPPASALRFAARFVFPPASAGEEAAPVTNPR